MNADLAVDAVPAPGDAVPAPGPTRTQRLGGLLDRLAANRFALWCVLVVLNALAAPYQGLHHDARLYAVQVSERIWPGSFGDDLYLRYGSQDRYSVFTPLIAPLVAALGVEHSFLIVYLLCKGLFLWAALRFIFTLLKDQRAAVLALVWLAMAPLPLGGNQIFHVNESFLTPRIVACALVLFGLERVLSGRPLVAVSLLGVALVIHPLMAMAGWLVAIGYWLLRWLKPWQFATLLAGVCGLAALVVLYEPLGERVFGVVDEEWKQVIFGICFFIRPDRWSQPDWINIGLSFAVCAAGALVFARNEWRFLTAVLSTGVAGLIGTEVGVESNYRLLIQASPYRALWLVQFLAVPLFCLWASKLWQQGTHASKAAALVVVVLAVTDWHFELMPALWVYLVLLGMFAVLFRGLAVRPRNEDWLWTSALFSFVTALVFMFIYSAGIAFIVLATPPDFTMDLHPLLALQVVTRVMYKLPMMLLALLIAAKALAWLGTRGRLAAAMVVVVVAYQAVVTYVPDTPWYGHRYSARYTPNQFVVTYVREHTPPGKKLTVYWPTDIRFLWFDADSKSYFNFVQLSGCAFERGTALEGKRRADLVQSFEIYHLLRSSINDTWASAFLNIFGLADPEEASPARWVLECQPNPTREQLLALCSDEQLDYAILLQPIDGLFSATDGSFYIYDCQKLRAVARR